MQRIKHRLKLMHKSFFRRVLLTDDEELLAKVLNMFDVTSLSIGNTVGVGSFIFIGRFIISTGPALLITNIFTAGIVLMSALCYADFLKGNLSGGAYNSTYQQIGELFAMIIGCLLSIEHFNGTALAARGLSIMIDERTDNKISESLRNYMSFTNPLLSPYPDVIAFFIPIVSLVMVSCNVKTVATVNNFCCLINVGMFVLIILVTGSNLNFENWSLPPSKECGGGGFFPYGIGSVFHGMAQLYSSYTGFDAAAHAGAEVKDPERIVPLSMIVAVIMIAILYSLQTFTYSLVWSYCHQDIDDPIPVIMERIGLDIMKWITAVSLPIGMLGNFICNTYPLSRLVYAMAQDGLLYSFLLKVNYKTRTPIYALYSCGICTALCALLMDTIQLAQLASLGAMSAYSVIAYSVLIVSYSDEEMEYGNTSRPFFKIILNLKEKSVKPTVISSSIVRICCWIIFLTSCPFLLILKMGYPDLMNGRPLEVSLLGSFILLYLTIIVVINRQPKSKERRTKRNIVPMVPLCVILINTYLCMEYSIYTWIHGIIWMSIGFLIYLTYGIWNSKARKQELLYEI